MNLPLKQKQNHRHREYTGGYQKGGVWGRIEWKVGVSRCKFFLYRMDKQQGPTI